MKSVNSLLIIMMVLSISCGKKKKKTDSEITLNPPISPSAISISGKVFLKGPYNPSTQKMSTMLNEQGLIPLNNPYNGTTFNHNGNESITVDFLNNHPEIVDWILVEIRSNLSSNSKIGSKAIFVDQDGNLLDLDGSTKISFSYALPLSFHVVLRHRNHLGVISNSITLSENTVIDFTTNPNFVVNCQNSQPGLRDLTNGVFGLHVGDVNQDKKIDYKSPGDKGEIEALTLTNPNNALNVPSFVYEPVYSAGDLNFDGKVKWSGENNDRDLILNSIGGVDPQNEVKAPVDL